MTSIRTSLREADGPSVTVYGTKYVPAASAANVNRLLRKSGVTVVPACASDNSVSVRSSPLGSVSLLSGLTVTASPTLPQ